ncbi:hypothetical protein A0J61_11443, partial [Choanephora cucurbitarum]
MASSAKKHNLPNKAISPNILPRAWASVVRGTDTTRTSLFTEAQPTDDAFASGTPNPFLKGTLPNSVFVGITNVKDVKKYFSDLTALCTPGDQLWGLEETPRVEGSRSFIECVFTDSLARKAIVEGLRLPSFEEPFLAFEALSADVKILKISISGLPRQYGRSNGGAVELKSDMVRIAGTFTGRGYVVLEVESASSSTLQHEVHWQYSYLSPRSNLPGSRSTEPSDAVKVYTTWAKMDPYCRYCHQHDHVIKSCTKRYASLICYNCHDKGHISKECPRKNSAPRGSSNKKARKTPSTFSVNTTEPVPNACILDQQAATDVVSPVAVLSAAASRSTAASSPVDASSSVSTQASSQRTMQTRAQSAKIHNPVNANSDSEQSSAAEHVVSPAVDTTSIPISSVGTSTSKSE